MFVKDLQLACNPAISGSLLPVCRHPEHWEQYHKSLIIVIIHNVSV